MARFYNQCDLVTCASRYLAADLASGGLTKPVKIVPNPIDTAFFYPRPNAFAPHKESAPRIVYCGRLAAEKNLPLLLRQIAPVLQRWPTATFEIIGDGPMRAQLHRHSQALGIGHRVRFSGWLHGTELAQHIASATVSVSASVTENQPMALLESLASGVPVVALSAAGVPEIVLDGENGFLAPVTAPEVIGQRVELLLRDSDLRAQMARRARISAESYSHDACMRRTIDAYDQAMGSSEILNTDVS
jgi:glycosyltransferase involved in cell wall biosynthesis